MLDDKKWLEWYSRLKEDRVKRSLGFLRPDEGTMDSVDRLKLMMDRGEGPREPINEDSIRKQLRLPRKEENKK